MHGESSLKNDKGLEDALCEVAAAEGVLLLGMGSLTPDDEPEFAKYQEWIRNGRHASMTYLERYADVRRQPSRLLSADETAGGPCFALVFAVNYAAGDLWRRKSLSAEKPRVAQYARWRDYHRAMRRAGSAFADMFTQRFAANTRSRVCVDTAPILEKALALRVAGGFRGRNSLYIHPQYGSYLLLGTVLTTAPLPSSRFRREVSGSADATPDVAPKKHANSVPRSSCGPCRTCVTHCPTGAILPDFQIDSRRCLSYWTIEHRGPIPTEFWPHLKNYYFGCDICQTVCPVNKKKVLGGRSCLGEAPRQFPELAEIAMMTDEEYRTWFGGTPMTRAKRAGLRRNALIAMTVSLDPALTYVLEKCAHDEDVTLQETLAQIRDYRSVP